MSVKAENLTKVRAHRWQIASLAFRQGGLELATAGWDKEVHIWDLNNLKVTSTLKDAHKVPVTCLSWQKQHTQLICTGSADNTAVLWNPTTGTALNSLVHHSHWVLGTTFSQSGSFVATSSWDKSVCIWDTDTGTLVSILKSHSGGVWSVDFHPHSPDLLCSSSDDGTIRIWDTRQGSDIQTLDLQDGEGIYCAKWSPDGSMIASGSLGKVCIWDIGSTSLLHTIRSHDDDVRSLAFNTYRNSSIPVLASAGGSKICLSDPRPNYETELLSIWPHGDEIATDAIGISPDGSILASGGRNGLLVLTSLQVPSVQPHMSSDSISNRLQSSPVLLNQPEVFGSIDSLAEVGSLASSELMTSSTTEDLMSLQDLPAFLVAGADDIQETEHPNNSSSGKNLSIPTTQKKQKKMVQSARESRKKRTEKKLVDLPTMIAHLTMSARGSVIRELSSSSESSDEESETNLGHKQALSNLINITHKVSTFSQAESKVLEPYKETRHPDPRVSLLEEDVPNAIKERRNFFHSKTTLGVDDQKAAHDSDESLSDFQSSRYSTKSPDSFVGEVGSGDEYCDDIPLSMI